MDPRYNCKIGVAVHMFEGDNVKLVNGGGGTTPAFNSGGSFFGFGKSEHYTQIVLMAVVMLMALMF